MTTVVVVLFNLPLFLIVLLVLFLRRLISSDSLACSPSLWGRLGKYKQTYVHSPTHRQMFAFIIISLFVSFRLFYKQQTYFFSFYFVYLFFCLAALPLMTYSCTRSHNMHILLLTCADICIFLYVRLYLSVSFLHMSACFFCDCDFYLEIEWISLVRLVAFRMRSRPQSTANARSSELFAYAVDSLNLSGEPISYISLTLNISNCIH